jgi:hypothetical protein
MGARTRTRLRRFAALAGRNGPGRALAVRSGPGTALADRTGPGTALAAATHARLRAIAKNAAMAYGDWRPTEVTVVPTTHAQAVPAAAPAPGAAVPGDTPVYLLAMTGHFSAGERHRPPGARGIPSRHLSVVVNAESFWVMDTALRRNPRPPLPTPLGEVTSIRW